MDFGVMYMVLLYIGTGLYGFIALRDKEFTVFELSMVIGTFIILGYSIVKHLLF